MTAAETYLGHTNPPPPPPGRDVYVDIAGCARAVAPCRRGHVACTGLPAARFTPLPPPPHKPAPLPPPPLPARWHLFLRDMSAVPGLKTPSPQHLHSPHTCTFTKTTARWHLFLRDMSAVPGLKMAAALAAQLGPAAAAAGRGGLREADVSGTLKKIPVDVGGGRVTVRARRRRRQQCGARSRVCLCPRGRVARSHGGAVTQAQRAAPLHAVDGSGPRPPLPPPQLSLYDVMPSGCVSDLVRLLEEWARDQ